MNYFTNRRILSAPQDQAGAALVVALILLVALTLMAIASMNAATLDLIMAGNEQYSSRAFAAAESGIANAIQGGTFNSTADTGPITVNLGVGSDSYSYTITRPSSGVVGAAPPGFSQGSGSAGFGTIPFRITATGTSERGSVVKNIQELLIIAPADNSGATCDSTLVDCSKQASADLGS